MICDGHPVSILAEISNNMFRFTKGWLTENNPSFAPGLFNMVAIITQEILCGKMLFHSGHELTPELKAKSGDRVKVFAGLADLLQVAPEGIAKCGNNAVHMGMKTEVLPPRVQYAYSAAFRRVMTEPK